MLDRFLDRQPGHAAKKGTRSLLRPDLDFAKIDSGDEPFWVVKDPLSATLYHLSETDYQLLQLLDCNQNQEHSTKRPDTVRHSAKVLLQRANEITRPHTISEESLLAFYRDAQRKNLLVGKRDDTSFPIAAQPRLNLLAWKLPGFPAEKAMRQLAEVVERLNPSLTWLSCLVLWLVGVAIVSTHFVDIGTEISTAVTRSGFMWWVGLLAVIGIAKVVHELAHGVCSSLCGAPCREMGVMLLVGAPCLYCDVSDAWMIPQQWKRVLVSAAGMIAELTLAGIAALGWLFSTPGVFHDLCLTTMLVCSVSTLFFNGNPLLRYDGYFILSDLIGAPNLASRARAAVDSFLRRIVWGPMERQDQAMIHSSVGRQLPRSGLIAFGIASGAYRLLMIFAIGMLLYRYTSSVALGYLGLAAGLFLMGSLWLAAFKRVLARPTSEPRVSIFRPALVISLGLISMVWLIAVPLPRSVQAPAIIESAGARDVVLKSQGAVAWAIDDGTHVKKDQALFKLQNDALENRWAEALGEQMVAEKRLEVLQRDKGGKQVSEQIAVESRRLESARQRLEMFQAQRQRLTTTAPVSGQFYAAPENIWIDGEDMTRETSMIRMVRLYGKRTGRVLEAGTIVGQVGDANQREVQCFVSQQHIGLVEVGQAATIHHASLPSGSINGEVIMKSAGVEEQIPESIHRVLPADEQNNPKRSLRHVVKIKLADSNAASNLAHRSTGSVNIHVAKTSLLARAIETARLVLCQH